MSGKRGFSYDQHSATAELFHRAESQLRQIVSDCRKALRARAVDSSLQGLQRLQLVRVRLDDYFTTERHHHITPYRHPESPIADMTRYPGHLFEEQHRALGSEIQSYRNALVELVPAVSRAYPVRLADQLAKAIERTFGVLRNDLDNRFCEDFPASDCRGIYYGIACGFPQVADLPG